MINKYKNASGELKQYKATKVKQGTAKNGSPYTVCTITDNKKLENGQWQKEPYGVFSWQPEITINENDLIEFLDITAFEVKEEEYQGQKRLKKTIFANIKVVPQEQKENAPQYQQTELTAISDSDLPF